MIHGIESLTENKPNAGAEECDPKQVGLASSEFNNLSKKQDIQERDAEDFFPKRRAV